MSKMSNIGRLTDFFVVELSDNEDMLNRFESLTDVEDEVAQEKAENVIRIMRVKVIEEYEMVPDTYVVRLKEIQENKSKKRRENK